VAPRVPWRRCRAGGRPEAARRAGLELVEKVVTNWRRDLMSRELGWSRVNQLHLGAMAHALEVLFDHHRGAIKDLWAQFETAGVPSLASRTPPSPSTLICRPGTTKIPGWSYDPSGPGGAEADSERPPGATPDAAIVP
jgi:hypothetical protein